MESRDVTVTRDSKLALVIAITMILLVGVLISDHMSGATGADFDTPEQTTPRSPVQTLSDPIAQIEPEPERSGPVEIAQGGETNLLDQALDRLRASETPTLVGERDASETLERSGLFSTIDSNSVTLPPREERRVESPFKRVAEPEQATPGLVVGVSGADWRTHTVVEGDSLYALARRYLGDGNRWRDIQKNNNDLLDGGDQIAVGMELRIDRVQRTRATAKPAAAPKRSEPTAERSYVVLPGDALSRVASKLLGSSKRMDEIVALNGLKDADDIKAGQTLRIPAR